MLLGADLYEFSWRYQLPALITLPIAGAFGATALVRRIRARRQPPPAAAAPAGPVGELAVAGRAGALLVSRRARRRLD